MILLLLLVCIVGAVERQPRRRVGRGDGDRSEWVMEQVTDFYQDMTGECSSMPATLSYSQRRDLHVQAAHGFRPCSCAAARRSASSAAATAARPLLHCSFWLSPPARPSKTRPPQALGSESLKHAMA